MKNDILLSNVLMDGIVRLNKKLKNLCCGAGFDAWEQYMIQPDKYHLEDCSCIVLLLDGDTLREKYPAVQSITKLLSLVADFAGKHTGIKIYISNVNCRLSAAIDIAETEKIERYEAEVNRYIYAISRQNQNIVCVNLKRLLNGLGEKEAYSKKMEYMSSCPYSMRALKDIADALGQMAYFCDTPRKKCLVLDFDNTLWGGIIGEDGESNIVISKNKEGKSYYDFQQILLKIKATGILLAAASKNNAADVKTVFTKDRMPIKESDFVVEKINWEPKSVSVMRIAEELNIGLDSIVFIDDNPAEREEVKNSLSGVEVPEFPKDPEKLEDFGLYVYQCHSV